MAKLQVILDGVMVEEFRLTRGRVTIGRRRQSDLRLESPVVSGDHALIERIGQHVYLEDRDSTNGTKLNGKKLTGSALRRQILNFGDEIGIGRYCLRYCDDNEPAQPSFEKTLMRVEHRSGGSSVDTRPVVEDTLVDLSKLAALPQGVLRVLTGSNAGRELKLEKKLTTLGKPGVQVAVVARRPQGYFLSQVEGSAGPRVNGAEVDSRPHMLKPGDQIELMGVRMVFEMYKSVAKKPVEV